MVKETTTIQIEREVLNKLKDLGVMGETYNDVIKRMLKIEKIKEKKKPKYERNL